MTPLDFQDPDVRSRRAGLNPQLRRPVCRLSLPSAPPEEAPLLVEGS